MLGGAQRRAPLNGNSKGCERCSQPERLNGVRQVTASADSQRGLRTSQRAAFTELGIATQSYARPLTPGFLHPSLGPLFRPFPVNQWVLLSARFREFEAEFSGPREEPSRTEAFRVNRESARKIAATTKQGEKLAKRRAAERSRSRRRLLTVGAVKFEAEKKAPQEEPSSSFWGESLGRVLRQNAGERSSSHSWWG